MNSFIKRTSILLLSTGAFAAHAGTDSITVKYILNVPTACAISNKVKAVDLSLKHDTTPATQSIDVKCNVNYTIKAASANKLGDNKSQLVNPQSTNKIPYDITLTGGPASTSVTVNGAASGKVAPAATTKTDSYILTAKTESKINIEEYMAGDYTDTVTVEISY
ncbi:spore coat protein U domain-containing protein [Acinetobacter terrestris]|uniref:spore coat protein U domain-containing protein n=1 Tax=Acinetobacter terrestris TaxID=2529843 RepID=UPI00103873FA|nr:spore coat protein U domain-containing protein [Acinetobacter terrestris]TCB50286.1 hypothetical protein E0H84_15100 [Acinetobacter terrestris]